MPAGRPKAKVDTAQVEQLAAINCSVDEIAAVVGVHTRTVQRNYATSIQKGRERGKSSLKRKMWEVAMGGNVTMLIWLSKQMLGYTDKIEEKVKTEEKITYKVNWADDGESPTNAPANTSAEENRSKLS